ncbi:BLUF domain-containing protein [uncultured Methylibium sp.]|uniref:BLUF domain-containing protein n=1 Tax=uncultured Methylibium sp. TaxID=381093 RepID=UPI0025F47B6D|nr:BLUF domain-containing protein [uncultured Methylibium sp.]
MEPLVQFLYLSRIAGEKPFEVVAEVAVQARRNNARVGITGVLVFDGAHVCQYVEGSLAEIDGLIERLKRDPRHEALQVLHHGPSEGERLFARWRMGYLLLDDGQELTRFAALRGPAAVRAVLDQLPLVDLEP